MYSPQFGINIPRDDYRGSDPRKREKLRVEHALCLRIEQELQRRYDAMKLGEHLVCSSRELAIAIGEDGEKVSRLIYRLDAGSNGVTLFKSTESQRLRE